METPCECFAGDRMTAALGVFGAQCGRRAALTKLLATAALPLSPFLRPFGAGTTIPLRIAFASEAREVAAHVTAWLGEADRVYASFGVSFGLAAQDVLVSGTKSHVESGSDRQQFGALCVHNAVNVFLVNQLGDVDKPGAQISGVNWAGRHVQPYIFVAAIARKATLAHELGHWLGLGHVPQRNNLMSYDRDEEHAFLAANQEAIVMTAGLARVRNLMRAR